jgi:Na+-driven multidrug efflux pump
MQIFTRDPAIIATCQTLLWLSFVLETGRVANLVVLAALRSTGDVVFPVATAVLSIFVVLGLGSTVMARHWGLVGIWIAYAADECLRSAMLFWRWETRDWVGHAESIFRRMRSPGVESRF